MKYYNIELFPSTAEQLQQFLDNCEDVWDYEKSEVGGYSHFEILTDPVGAEKINNYIEYITEGAIVCI